MQLLESLAEPRNGGIICLQCGLSGSDDGRRLSVDILGEELRDSSHIRRTCLRFQNSSENDVVRSRCLEQTYELEVRRAVQR